MDPMEEKQPKTDSESSDSDNNKTLSSASPRPIDNKDERKCSADVIGWGVISLYIIRTCGDKYHDLWGQRALLQEKLQLHALANRASLCGEAGADFKGTFR
jgi:hypothetical protein